MARKRQFVRGQLLVPEAANLVVIEYGIEAEDRKTFKLTLGNEHSIEWILVGSGQGSCDGSMANNNGQSFERLPCEHSVKIQEQRFGTREFAQPGFSGDLPSGGRTNDDIV